MVARKKFRSTNKDFSFYFVVNTWEDPPIIQLIRRNSDAAVELAEIEMPESLIESFLENSPTRPGVYAPDGKIRDWLEKELE